MHFPATHVPLWEHEFGQADSLLQNLSKLGQVTVPPFAEILSPSYLQVYHVPLMLISGCPLELHLLLKHAPSISFYSLPIL